MNLNINAIELIVLLRKLIEGVRDLNCYNILSRRELTEDVGDAYLKGIEDTKLVVTKYIEECMKCVVNEEVGGEIL